MVAQKSSVLRAQKGIQGGIRRRPLRDRRAQTGLSARKTDTPIPRSQALFSSKSGALYFFMTTTHTNGPQPHRLACIVYVYLDLSSSTQTPHHPPSFLPAPIFPFPAHAKSLDSSGSRTKERQSPLHAIFDTRNPKTFAVPYKKETCPF